MPSQEEIILDLARNVGFSLVGIAPVTPHERANRIFRRWIARGGHAEMRWLERHAPLRETINAVLPGARSAVCVAVNYYHPVERTQREADGRDSRGVFSIYAQNEDYHTVLGDMLRRFETRVHERYPDDETARCVDTKPVSDRTLALRSGIGWLGKNTAVITPEFGSWVFLGALLTTLNLAPGTPMETLCAGCSRCIDACPTGALDTPFVLDAKKCISYLTIEKRGKIDPDLAGRIGVDVYGCDTCQSVCPYNSVASQSRVFHRSERSPLVDMTLAQLKKISDGEFRALTRNSAIRRCRAEGLRRNVRIVQDNLTRGPVVSPVVALERRRAEGRMEPSRGNADSPSFLKERPE